MNKILILVWLCSSFCITACQTFADEGQTKKRSAPASEVAVTSPENLKQKRQEKKAGLVEHTKIHQVRSLAPAVFTMIKPYTLDRSPVKLPQNQILD